VSKYIKEEEVKLLLSDMIKNGDNLFYDDKSHSIFKYGPEKKEKIVRLPLIWNKLPENLTNIEQISSCNKEYIVLIIETGQAGLGIFKDGRVIEHKVIRKYMTRKKQGKSQLKYLKTKGKSRAGSRVRLKNSIIFFEEINEYIKKWFKSYNICRVLYYIPKPLINIWLSSKVSLPFDKKDENLIKIPINMNTPTFELVKKIAKFAYDGESFIIE